MFILMAMKSKSWLYVALSWLVPGSGFYLLGRRRDGVIIFLSIVYFFFVGLLLGGRFVGPNEGSPLTVFLTFAQLGNGLLFFAGKLLGFGSKIKVSWSSDYGTFFIMGGGLINYLATAKVGFLLEGK